MSGFRGRVARIHKGGADVLTPDDTVAVRYGSRIRRAAAADPTELPCVGDWVMLRDLPGDEYEITEILPRGTAFVRGGVARDSRDGLSGDSRGQILAANVDVAFVVEPTEPDTNIRRVERFVALAWNSGAVPVVLISKADAAGASMPELLADVAEAAPGVDVHAVSAHTGAGLDAVRSHLTPDRTAVFLGASGSGKSTLVNALAGEEVMATQQIRASDGRGRHTTVHRELITLPSGATVIDTPGIRRVGLYEMGDGVEAVFAEIDELAAACRFRDCAHEDEPGCAVRTAVTEGRLPERRLRSWRKLQREAAWMASRTDARLRKEHVRRWKIADKEVKRHTRP